MRIRLLGLLAPIAALLSWPGMGAAAQGATRLLVSPAHPHPTTAVVIAFVQPQTAAGTTAARSAETLRVAGPASAGCSAGAAQSIGGVAAGTRLRETLRPSRGDGGRWCLGEYRASLVLTRSSGCPIGTGKRICPQFVIAPTVVATTRFRITAG